MINGAGTPTGGGTAPATAVGDLIAVLREARETQRENERALAATEVGIVQERADLARDKAEAARGQAWLRFTLSMSESLSSLTGAVVQGCRRTGDGRAEGRQLDTEQGEEHAGPSRRALDNSDLDRVVGLTCEAFRASDETFGFGERIRQAEVESAELDVRAESTRARAESVRIEREDLDDALSEAREAYRELARGNGGGES